MGSKNNPGKFDCYEAAHPDEPMFVLLGRDESAPHLVRLWANIRMGDALGAVQTFATLVNDMGRWTPDLYPGSEGYERAQAKAEEARYCAEAMEDWVPPPQPAQLPFAVLETPFPPPLVKPEHEPSSPPEPPWEPGYGNNGKRSGWIAFFANLSREKCPFPPDRQDLFTGFLEGWDAAKEYADGADHAPTPVHDAGFFADAPGPAWACQAVTCQCAAHSMTPHGCPGYMGHYVE